MATMHTRVTKTCPYCGEPFTYCYGVSVNACMKRDCQLKNHLDQIERRKKRARQWQEAHKAEIREKARAKRILAGRKLGKYRPIDGSVGLSGIEDDKLKDAEARAIASLSAGKGKR